MEVNRDIRQQVLAWLPYGEGFRFVDELEVLTEERVVGYYRFTEDAFFYQGHFKDHPVTPGVILTECMAQIGVVCLGIYLLRDQIAAGQVPGVALSSQAVDYFKPVYPGEQVRVEAARQYFRFGKLKCEVAMYNEQDDLVCKGTLAGMTKKL
ncbi:MAG: hydroxymyristoyl-ACP dehydratase [Bacteroidota bacterium]